MRKNELIRVAVAESSVVIRTGMALVLKRLPSLRVQPIELASVEALNDCMRTQDLDVLIVSPTFGEYFDLLRFREKFGMQKGVKIVALVSSFVDTSLLNKFDDRLSIFDSIETITTKLSALLNTAEEEDEDEGQETLSYREREIVVCVVKGMTNKEIADQLFLSIHTVITHRRNISRKLQIHSASGLTIYAIVNKLISLDEVKDL
ncbi:MAG: response regulator transcription factor [Bacteroides sp.]